MRIAFVFWKNGIAGGVESYITRCITQLQRAGHEIFFLYQNEFEKTDGKQSYYKPLTSCCSDVDEGAALSTLRAWQPDVVFNHGLQSPNLEEQVLAIAPTLLFAHGHYGTCVTGTKTFCYPNAIPCQRKFGVGCLWHFYPRRCGGRSPLTMWRQFKEVSAKNKLLSSYSKIIVFSEYMRKEYAKHGHEGKTVLLPIDTEDEADANADVLPSRLTHTENSFSGGPLCLLYLGRFVHLKGGDVLLKALPEIQSLTSRNLRVVLAGTGYEQKHWEELAAAIMINNPRIKILFPGWITKADLPTLLQTVHLLAFPSVCPETFGLVGPEVGRYGIPSVAFNVGGIGEWLREGVNGHLAPACPPTASGLALAVARAVSDWDHYSKISAGAVQIAQRFSADNHLRALLAIASDVVEVSRRKAQGSASM